MRIDLKKFIWGMLIGCGIFMASFCFTLVVQAYQEQNETMEKLEVLDMSVNTLDNPNLSQSPNPTTTPILTPSLTPSLTPTPTSTPVPTAIPIPKATATSIPTPTQAPVPTITPTPTVVSIPQTSDVYALVSKYATEYGIDEALLRKIGQCESSFNQASVNGPYGGIYQFHHQTWSTIRTAMGLDPNPDLRFDAEESIRTAAYKISVSGASAWPACSN